MDAVESITVNWDYKDLNVPELNFLIWFLDNIMTAVGSWRYQFIDTKIEIANRKDYSESHFFSSPSFNKSEMQEILKIIKNRSAKEWLNTWEKNRIMFLVWKLQKYIELKVRDWSEKLGIDIDSI